MSIDDYKVNNDCLFHPVQGPEEVINQLPSNEGYIYFATDSGKIFLGQKDKKVQMCAASGFFYGIKEIEYDNSGVAPDPEVTFFLDEIEGDAIPEIDDLILNKDGCFYRVKTIEDDEIDTTRLTLQGSGGGGSGPGGGGDVSGGSFSINAGGKGSLKSFSSTATEMLIKFTGNYNGTDGNVISSVALKRKDDEEPFCIVDQMMPFNEEHSIDIYPYKHLFNSNQTTVYIYVYDLYGYERSTNFKVQIVNLELTKTRDNLISSFTSSYNYSCKLNGATSGVSDKKITYKLYADNGKTRDADEPIITYTKNLNPSDNDEIQNPLDLSKTGLGHGVYVLKVQASANVAGSSVPLTSNVLSHKIAYFDATIGDALLMVYFPEKTEQYTNIPVEYLLLTEESNEVYTLDISLDNVSQIKLNISSNNKGEYSLYFEEQNNYVFKAAVMEMSTVSYSSNLNINPYTGNLPIIDSSRSDLMLYLNPRNKSNEATDRDEWNDYNGTYKGVLSGLHYGKTDGWLIDSNGINYLQLASGATFNMPNFRPFEKDPTKLDPLDSNMGSGMTIELDFELNGVLDYDTELISCLSRNKDDEIRVGFTVTGDKVRFYSGRGSLLSLTLIEGKRTRVSFVIEPNTGVIEYPMIYGYMDGVLSGAVIYDTAADDFKDASDGPALLYANSEKGQIKIYGIRVYTAALSDRIILNNYTASLPTLAEREAAYNSNNVYNGEGQIDVNKVIAEEYDLQIPYMILTGGYGTEKESKWQRKDSSDPVGRLPTGKKDYRMVDVKVRYPKTSLFAGYNDYDFVNQFASGKTMAEAYGERPSNGGAIMYGQGTSSMEYPVKNLRLRFKQESDWYTVKPDISPVEIICMKADYMESSGSHNTGSANLIDALYKGVGIKTPGQRAFGGDGKSTIVTCIKGHPCLIFFSPTGEEGTYEYIGKYNLNLDKATPKPFGFDHSDDFGWLHEDDKYYEVKYADKAEGYKDPFVGQIEPDEGADYVPNQKETEKTVAAGQKVNAIHCFEFLDNAIEVCNFLNKYKNYVKDPETGEMVPDPTGGTYSYQETWYNEFTNKDGDKVPGWALGFESRYPEDRLGFHDADTLYPLASWLNELHTLRNRDAAGKAEAEARFKNEYQCYLNKDFTLTYYLYTEALLMADSRVKNMMIATWGKENYGEDGKGIGTNQTYSYLPLKQEADGTWVPDETQERIYTNNYIFYPIFYDMDTMLGLDNTGIYRFNYYDEDTNPSIYNGDEVLWTFVRDSLLDDLTPWYTELETAKLRADEILPYFNNNQANLANQAFYNGDAKYKYIRPAREGYHDDLNDKDIAAGDGPYLYAAQGDRTSMREWFVTNRMKFLRGKYASGQFKGGDRIEYRWYYPSGNETEFKIGIDGKDHSASVTAVPPSDSFKFKSLKTGYAGVQIGANASKVHTVRFDGEEEKTVEAPEAGNANGTEAYILGLSNLTDLGDLSNKYMQKFIIASSDVRLQKLTLGNPHRDYYNPHWASNQGESLSLKIGLTGATYLKEFNLQNCLTYNNSLDFSACPVIERILLTGSGVSSISLPSGGILTELRLPTSVKKIDIEAHSNLVTNNFSIGEYEYDETDPRIGEGNGKYLNDYSRITSVRLVDMPQLDSYAIVSKASSLEEYCLRNVNWNITEEDTQYCIRYNSDALTPAQIKSYYTYNKDTKTYELWGQETYPTEQNVYLFERFDMVKDGKVVCIPVLEYLKSKNFIDSTKHAEALSGNIVLSIPNATADEYALYEQYATTYPDLMISCENMDVQKAYEIKFFPSLSANEMNGIDIDKQVTKYTIKSNGSQTLTELATTYKVPTPQRADTNKLHYNYFGEWIDYADTNKTHYWTDYKYEPRNKAYFESHRDVQYWQKSEQQGIGYVYYVYDSSNYPEGDTTLYEKIIPDTSFTKYKPKADMKLVPVFEEATRYYKLSFHTADTVFEIGSGSYDQSLASAVGWASSVKCQFKDSSDLPADKHYVFRGWTSAENGPASMVIDFSNEEYTIKEDMDFYACFTEESIYEVSTPLIAFDIGRQGHLVNNRSETAYYLNGLNEDYYREIRGKIVLPRVDAEGNLITHISNFIKNNSMFSEVGIVNSNDDNTTYYYYNGSKYYVYQGTYPSEVTLYTYQGNACGFNYPVDVYVVNDNGYEVIADQSFVNAYQENLNTGVLNLHLENASKLKTIGQEAFKGYHIQNIYLPDTLTTIHASAFYECYELLLNKLPRDLTTLGTQAFKGCSAITISELPVGLTKLESNTFNGCGNITISEIPTNVTEIGNYCFNNCTNIQIDELDNVTIGKAVFYGAGKNVTTFTFGRNVYFSFDLATTDEYGKVFSGNGYPSLNKIYCYWASFEDNESNYLFDSSRSLPSYEILQ